MPCYHQIPAFVSLNAIGKKTIFFRKPTNIATASLPLPCYNCIGCRLDRSQQWAKRIQHHASQYEDNSFVTLTYQESSLPYGGTLVKSHFQKFIRDLRYQFRDQKISYYHAGEYSEYPEDKGKSQLKSKLGRPHYHACLFNCGFEDRVIFKERDGIITYTSELLSEIWGRGFVTTGDVTEASAGYCARYVTKKINGDLADEHYERVVEQTGEVIQLQPEYSTMSLRPAIGKEWFAKYKSDCYPSDYLCSKSGKKAKVPSYYDRLYEKSEPEQMALIKEKRLEASAKKRKDRTPERLAVRKICKIAQIESLVRPLDGPERHYPFMPSLNHFKTSPKELVQKHQKSMISSLIGGM